MAVMLEDYASRLLDFIEHLEIDARTAQVALREVLEDRSIRVAGLCNHTCHFSGMPSRRFLRQGLRFAFHP